MRRLEIADGRRCDRITGLNLLDDHVLLRTDQRQARSSGRPCRAMGPTLVAIRKAVDALEGAANGRRRVVNCPTLLAMTDELIE
jgi:hypothetical protein